MNTIITSVVAFVCILVGMMAGTFLRSRLPAHHIRDDSRDAVKMGTGLIATLTALVLGLLISSAKSSYDAINTGLTQAGAKIMSLDRIMAQYGPETKDARHLLRRVTASAIKRTWPEENIGYAELEPVEAVVGMEELHSKLQALSPQNDDQRWFAAQALQISGDLAMSRWQIIEQAETRLPTSFLIVLVGWLAILFASFGLLSPRNVTVITVLLLCALSVSGALFLLLEMSHPITGAIKVSSAPLLKVLEYLGK